MSSRRSSGEDAGGQRSAKRKPRKRKPLDESSLRDLALSYVARFATSGAKLEAYLVRKIRERGVVGADDCDPDEEPPRLDVRALVEQFVELGYVDDAAYAKSRSRDLMARGYGARRVDQALYAAGIDEDVREDQTPSEAAARRAAILLARKRGFGPFSRKERDPKLREKQIAAMLRAGHDFAAARAIVGAENEEEIDQWLAEAEEEETGKMGLW
ncbi:MAG: RecX family transcriptional regulator [Pseudomonadota bacterium]